MTTAPICETNEKWRRHDSFERISALHHYKANRTLDQRQHTCPAVSCPMPGSLLSWWCMEIIMELIIMSMDIFIHDFPVQENIWVYLTKSWLIKDGLDDLPPLRRSGSNLGPLKSSSINRRRDGGWGTVELFCHWWNCIIQGKKIRTLEGNAAAATCERCNWLTGLSSAQTDYSWTFGWSYYM